MPSWLVSFGPHVKLFRLCPFFKLSFDSSDHADPAFGLQLLIIHTMRFQIRPAHCHGKVVQFQDKERYIQKTVLPRDFRKEIGFPALGDDAPQGMLPGTAGTSLMMQLPSATI